MVVYIFKCLDDSQYSVLAPNLWQEHFKMFELNEIMRQKESKVFAEILNRLREGNHTDREILKIKERIIYKDNSLINIPHTIIIQNRFLFL